MDEDRNPGAEMGRIGGPMGSGLCTRIDKNLWPHFTVCRAGDNKAPRTGFGIVLVGSNKM